MFFFFLCVLLQSPLQGKNPRMAWHDFLTASFGRSVATRAFNVQNMQADE